MAEGGGDLRRRGLPAGFMIDQDGFVRTIPCSEGGQPDGLRWRGPRTAKSSIEDYRRTPEGVSELADLLRIAALRATLFDAIAHGSDEHLAWLKQAIDDHFAGRMVQPGCRCDIN